MPPGPPALGSWLLGFRWPEAPKSQQPTAKSSSTLEREVHLLLLFRTNGDALFLPAVLLVPRDDRIRTGRQVGNRIRAVHRRDPVIRVRQHDHPRLHPAVDVALHLERRRLGLVELLRRHHSLNGLP